MESDFNGVEGMILLSLYSYNFHTKIQLNYFPAMLVMYSSLYQIGYRLIFHSIVLVCS